jgi:hypothetical protein
VACRSFRSVTTIKSIRIGHLDKWECFSLYSRLNYAGNLTSTLSVPDEENTMAQSQPSTPLPAGPLFGGSSTTLVPGGGATPGSVASSNNTFLMPNSPVKSRPISDNYRPKVTRTLGQRPACLVNATVTYCGNNVRYSFLRDSRCLHFSLKKTLLTRLFLEGHLRLWRIRCIH